jgi:exopolysaccharide biosynthesis polyprenyl glycosylphosphotransferase
MMAQVRAALDSQADPAVLPINRISLPFLRVQERKWLLGAVDALLVGGWLILSYELWRVLARPGSGNMSQVPWRWVLGGSAVWLLVSWLAGAYELDRADRFWKAARTTLTVSLVTTTLALGAYYAFLKTYPRPALGLALVCVPASVLLWRAVYAATLRRPASAIRLLVVGNEALCNALSEAARGQEGYYRVLGFTCEQAASGPAYLGDIADLGALAARFGAHRIVVAPREYPLGVLSDGLVAVLCDCIERGIEVVDFNAAYEEIAGKVAVEHVKDFWLAALPTRPNTSSLEEALMRLLDILGASVGLLFTAIVGPLIATAVLFDSGRPIIYRQERLGLGGRPFTLYKLRSMRQDAESTGARWAVRGDARATRVGRFLRRTHLDELPQLWNVLRGDMSLVGPRPERPEFTDHLSGEIPFYRLRLSVRPGLTGLKQINCGYASTPEEHLEVLRHDLYYIKHRSLALNLLIMWRTLGWMLRMKGR